MPLPSLQEVWAHARRFNWDVRSFFGFIWQLSGAQISTKETLEDCLGDLTDIYSRERKGGNRQMAPERVFLHYTMSERLSTRYVQLEQGDFRNAASRNFGSDRAAVFGENMKVSCSACKLVADMKKTCKEGLVFRSGFQSLNLVFCYVCLCADSDRKPFKNLTFRRAHFFEVTLFSFQRQVTPLPNLPGSKVTSGQLLLWLRCVCSPRGIG